MSYRHSGSSAAALAFCLLAAPAYAQQTIVVASGTTDTTPKTVGGTDTVTVQAGGTLATTTNPAINWSTGSTDLRIANSGTIRTTANGGRAINASGASNPRTVTLTNNAGGLIESQDDAFRINVLPTGGAIRVDNYGTIRTTNGGQALDFDAVAGGATIAINNYAGGELRAFGQDGIRPGQGAVVTNAGLILSDGLPNNSYDGIDWQARSGVVVNTGGGTISGLRHGITSDTAVDVTNAGTILGRNGSGVGSDGTGRVVNTGTITGQWDGVAINGDGDGVDIDFIGSVVNSGTIQGLSATGVDSGGRPNSAEGVAMGGGTIQNNAGATIFGAGNAVLVNHDTNPGGVADGATTIANAGTIRAGSGSAIRLVGNFADTITNSGTITGGAAGAIDMGGGDDTLNLLTGSVVTGTVDGGAGNDLVTLGGAGTGGFAGAVNVERLSVTGGNWTLTAPAAFTGGTTIAAGRLTLAGALTSAVSVQSGGTVSGTGPVASLAVAAGGTVAPGAGVGTLSVTGALTQAAGSIYQAETSGAGAADRIAVGGTATIGAGAQLAVSRDAGGYTVGTRYTLLTAAGGVTGSYTLVQTAAGGTEFRVGQNGTSVFVDLARTATSLGVLAATRNQAAVAPALAALGVGNAAYAALTLIPDDAAVRRGIDALSGEIHASVRTATTLEARAAQDALRARIGAPVKGVAIWAQGVRRAGTDDGVDGGADADRQGWGGVGGIDLGLGETARIGVAGGYTRTDLDGDACAGNARLKTTHALVYAGGTFGRVALRAGGGYAWVRNDVRRAVAFAGFGDALASRYDGHVLHGFAEAGIALPVMRGSIEPFAGAMAFRVHGDGFTETGGAAALSGARRSETFTLSNLGLRASTPIVAGVGARGSASWQRVLGDTRPDADLRFAGGSVPFRVTGTGLSRNAVALSLDLAWTPRSNVTLTAGYAGTIGGRGDDSSLRAGIAVGF